MDEPAFVRFVEIVDAPREAVFRAWTDPVELASWWGPGAFTTPSAEVDLRPGGRYELVMQPAGGGDPLLLAGEYREVTPPARLVYTWRWESGVPDPRESVVTVEFRDLGERTEVVLVHDNFVGPGPIEPYRMGWESGLEKLAAYVEGR
jgi:uncharacterized protein YndB with AHSA1/START domain